MYLNVGHIFAFLVVLLTALNNGFEAKGDFFFFITAVAGAGADQEGSGTRTARLSQEKKKTFLIQRLRSQNWVI